MNYLALFVRILGGIANVLNMRKKKKYTEDPAGTIANDPDGVDGGVQQSDKSFSDLASEAERDRVD